MDHGVHITGCKMEMELRQKADKKVIKQIANESVKTL